jgi:hypothetical protein
MSYCINLFLFLFCVSTFLVRFLFSFYHDGNYVSSSSECNTLLSLFLQGQSGGHELY